MITLTTLLQQHGATYREQRRTQLSPQQSRCLATLALCRTEALGGQVFTCPDCHTVRYSYHSC
ncbi:MAG TPA: transposase zinc-binding domain-containing protein, partial [Prosthecobacter sp.]|nr:transposase zinc-binding domain-containing protein [Prosthecobacter sp.]